MSRRVVRTYAVANLKDKDEVMAASAKEKKREHPAVDTESDEDNGPDVPKSPPKPKRGRPPGKAKVTKTVAPKGDMASTASVTGTQDPKPVMVRGKILPQRSPLPTRMNRNTHPGAVSKPRAKRTSAEVTAVAKHKAALQQRIVELEQQRIEALAEMELQEELDEEAEEHAVVRKTALVTSLDGAEDVEMWSKDDVSMEVPVDSNMVSKDEEADAQVAPKLKQV
jgi:hypothetical protein